MRANRTYGSEGGEGESPSLPLSFFASSHWVQLQVNMGPGFRRDDGQAPSRSPG